MFLVQFVSYILHSLISRNQRDVIRHPTYLLYFINFKLHFNKVGERLINKVQYNTKSVPGSFVMRIRVALELVYSRFMYTVQHATCNPAGVG